MVDTSKHQTALCALGLHAMPKWQDYAEVKDISTHIETGKTVERGQKLVQVRQCNHCGAKKFRTALVYQRS